MMREKQKGTDDIYERDDEGNILGERLEIRNKPGHHTGRNSGHGYTLTADGKYKLAPSDQDVFRDIVAEIDSAHELLRVITDHLHSRITKHMKMRTQWFVHICQNVYREGDFAHAHYSMADGVLYFEMPKDDEKDKS